MAVEVAADRPGLLVLSEIYYPSWRAAVNGTPSMIQRVDGGLRGIVVARMTEVGSNSHTLRSTFTRAVRARGQGVVTLGIVLTASVLPGGRIPGKRSASGRRKPRGIPKSTQTAAKPSAGGRGSTRSSRAARQRLSLSGIRRAWIRRSRGAPASGQCRLAMKYKAPPSRSIVTYIASSRAGKYRALQFSFSLIRTGCRARKPPLPVTPNQTIYQVLLKGG
jgi:hypothetical protein